MFEQKINKICSLLNNASFGTFCIPIGQLFDSQGVFEGRLSQRLRFDVFEAKSMLNKKFPASSKTHCDWSNLPI